MQENSVFGGRIARSESGPGNSDFDYSAAWADIGLLGWVVQLA
jgi:hypothetical protein